MPGSDLLLEVKLVHPSHCSSSETLHLSLHIQAGEVIFVVAYVAGSSDATRG